MLTASHIASAHGAAADRSDRPAARLYAGVRPGAAGSLSVVGAGSAGASYCDWSGDIRRAGGEHAVGTNMPIFIKQPGRGPRRKPE